MPRTLLPLDLDLSRRTARRIEGINRECWWNARRAMSRIKRPGVFYVEGHTVPDGMPIVADHAWLEIEGVCVVDPTPVYANGTPRAYFAARRFTLEEMRAAVKASRGQVPLTTAGDWMAPLRHPDWRRSYIEAETWAWGREMALQVNETLRGFKEAREIILAAEEGPHIAQGERQT